MSMYSNIYRAISETKIGTLTGIEAFSGVRALIGMRVLTPLGCLLCDDRFSPANWKTGGLNLRGRDNNNWGK